MASRAFERAALLAPEETHRALYYAAADAAWLGGLPNAPSRSWPRRAGTHPRPGSHRDRDLRGHIAARRGPIRQAQEILLAGAERAATVDPSVPS